MTKENEEITTEAAVPENSKAFPLGVALVCLLFVAVYFIKGQDYAAFWMSLFIKPMSIPYGDLQSLVAALECIEQGLDPMMINPCDIGGRGLLLPRTWLVLGALGLSKSTVDIFAFLIVLQMLVAFILLLRPAKWNDVLIALLICFSPPILLGIERVNSDLLTFGCLVFAALLFSQKRQASKWLGTLVLFLATALKLYPVAGALMLLKEKGPRSFFFLGVFIVLSLAFAIGIFSDIQTIRSVDANRHLYGVGHAMIWLHLAPLLEEWASYDLLVSGWRLVEGPILAVVCIWMLRHKETLRVFGARLKGAGSYHVNAYVLGASIYCAFFLLHSFYDYKLLILVLVLPLLLWLKNQNGTREQSQWAWMMIGSIGLIMWLGIYFWWTVFDQAFFIDLREVPFLYYGSLLIRFGLSWGLLIGFLCSLAGIVLYRLNPTNEEAVGIVSDDVP